MRLNLKGKIIAILIVVLGFAMYVTYRYMSWHETNKACHKQCQTQGYDAGEETLKMVHTVCECFSKKAGPPVRFLLEASDTWED
jgi:hypothetical protein